jgi:hypothetical protein
MARRMENREIEGANFSPDCFGEIDDSERNF